MTRSRVLTYLLTVGLVLCMGVGAASALQQNSVARGTNDKSIHKAGQNVDITGTVNGDVYCAGQTVTVDATVNGDVLCAGQTVTVDGTVHGNVRVAGQTVSLNSQVDKSVTIAAQTANIGSGTKIGNDLSLFARSTHVNGNVGRDITGGSEDMTISGTVGRNIDANVDTLVLESGAKVGGNVTYTSQHTVQMDRGAVVSGQVIKHAPSKQANHHHVGSVAGWLLFGLIVFLMMLVFALVLVALFPWFFREASQTMRGWPWWELLIGFLASLFVPAIIFMLLLTIVGIPLAILLILFWIAASLVSGTLTAFYIGRLLLPRRSAPLMMLVGGVLLAVLYLIPFLNLIVIPLAYWIGLGLLLVYLWRGWRHPVYHEAEPTTRGATRTSKS
jgi:hypothetical protein